MEDKMMREAFEKWAALQLHDLEKLSLHGTYRSNATRGAWYAWQAALSTLPTMTEGEIAQLIYEDCGIGDQSGALKAARALISRFPQIVKEGV